MKSVKFNFDWEYGLFRSTLPVIKSGASIFGILMKEVDPGFHIIPIFPIPLASEIITGVVGSGPDLNVPAMIFSPSPSPRMFISANCFCI